ncbi:hypothetical protein BAE47_06820 [Acidithiobacillus thiooxidans]|uniref:HDOD domain-containing protein n=5 Tax=Acidithiobacillus thiooxidans TaxID=930 RepID=UPI000466C355|nr:HDOD domain-containing protein [Acidithiobacillus thiooxidans]OFC48729.1 hypothetical protein BAE47_06820 [Acidithiobacillus thiooxidans]
MTAKELALLLSQRDIPLLGSTVNQILALTEEEDAKSITEIGALISRDPALAALILRMANSSFFNPGGTRIYTLSRALIVLGLQQMRTLCYSAVLLETTVKTQFQDQVFPLLKKSLEMAGQAQFLAQKLGGDGNAYFLAGLLDQIGRIAFWCAGGGDADRLNAALLNGEAPAAAERRLLGFTLDQVNAELRGHWGLSHLQNLPTLNSINILKEATELVDGLQRKDLRFLENKLNGLRHYFRQSSQDLLKSLRQVREQSLAMVPMEWLQCQNPGARTLIWTDSDPTAQLQSIADMHAFPQTGAYLSTLLQTALEGLHRGGGWDLCVFAVRLSSGWVGKLKSGWHEGPAEDWGIEEIAISGSMTENWTRVQLKTDADRRVLYDGTYGAAGILRLKGKPAGLLYADRTRSARPVGPDQFQAFEIFYRQLNLILQNLQV